MPGMDGFETASLIRQRRSTEHMPIIFVTAFGDETHASRGYSLGAVDYIQTPVVPEVLKTKVAVFVDLFRKTQQVRRRRNRSRTARASSKADGGVARDQLGAVDRADAPGRHRHAREIVAATRRSPWRPPSSSGPLCAGPSRSPEAG